MQTRVLGAVAGLLLLAVVEPSGAQPKNIPSSSIVSEAKEAKESISTVGLMKEFIVSGDTVYDSYFVGSETITFKSGARLIFSDKALKLRNNLIVVAKTIVMEDQGNPGLIAWMRGDGPGTPPPQSGQAPGGSHGAGDGDSGGPGSPGVQGNPGNKGLNAPNLTLFVLSMKGAPATIDLRGQSGGKGGAGQKGGDGGVGHQGSPASSSAFDCKSGAGHGGNGGPGGPGGKGGTGGAGGVGGTVTLVSVPDAFPTLLQLVRADVGGGEPGDGGDGGTPGNGGPGGAQGAKALPFCKDEPGRKGNPGAGGQAGEKGDKGSVGTQGDVFYTTLSVDTFKKLFGAQ